MDSNSLFRCTNPGYATLYECNPPNITIQPDWLFWPMKSNLDSSPDSPLSAHIVYDRVPSFSNSQEQYSPVENFLGVSPSRNLSFDGSFLHFPSKIRERHPLPSVGWLPQYATRSMKHTLQEIESERMGPHDEASTTCSACSEHREGKASEQHQIRVLEVDSREEIPLSLSRPCICSEHHKTDVTVSPEKRQRVSVDRLQISPHSDLKQLLIQCARVLSENRLVDFDRLIKVAKSAVSISGTPVQRLGAYMVEGLVARKEESGITIYRALQCKEPECRDLLSHMPILYEICPFFKFGYMAANGAIAEAFRNEDRVHIIDFQIAQGTQWFTLIQALAARPGGPPRVRITGVGDPVSQYAHNGCLDAVGRRLAAMSQRFNIPLEFHPLPVFASEVTRDMLVTDPGEALAVNFALQLHRTPDESVDLDNPRDGLLRMVKSLSPKVTTLVEQESNTNTASFVPRFRETLDFYSAMFESIDVALPRDCKERINVEQQCLARDIVNIIACEKQDRVERHELLGKWRSRLSMAGFKPFPLSSYVNSVIRSLLKSYSENYTLEEKDGAMLLGWKDRKLISASAWH